MPSKQHPEDLPTEGTPSKAGHPWRQSFIRHEEKKDLYAHPNSVYAKAKGDSAQMDRILDGMREADEDLQAMERWYRNGFISG